MAPAEWEAHARVHRRAVRDAIERARIAVAATMGARGPSSPQAMANLLRMETGERLFGALIALADLAEHTTDPAIRPSASRLLRRLLPLLRRLGDATWAGDPRRLRRVIDHLTTGRAVPPALAHLVESIAASMHAALRLKHDSERSDITLAASLPAPDTGSLLEGLRSNLTWNSVILRHAVRVTGSGNLQAHQ